MLGTRPQFQTQSLIDAVRTTFQKFTSEDTTNSPYSLANCFMSAFAMFNLKYPSLLQFDQDNLDPKSCLAHNLKSLYKVDKAPCDTTMRQRLDGVSLEPCHKIIDVLIDKLQRAKVLEDFVFINGCKLFSLDGTEFFSSSDIHCEQCCVKKFNAGKANEKTIYTHQMLVGSIVNPSQKQVFPVGFEPICKEDGAIKNDCELNAGKRWVGNFRKSHPHMKAAIVADGLYSDAPFIKLLQEQDIRFLLVAKEADHVYLNDWFWALNGEDIEDFTEIASQGKEEISHRYRFAKNIPLNSSNSDLLVNVIYYEERIMARTIKTGKINEKTIPETVTKWMWVTDFDPTIENVRLLVKGGRARWKIENETFNTLKNQGYNFEHNYGHGTNGLNNLFAGIMLIGFLLDQINLTLNKSVQECYKRAKSYLRLWIKTINLVLNFFVDSWQDLYCAILDPPRYNVKGA